MKTPKTQIIVVQILNILSPNKNRTNNPQATENKNVIYGFFIYSLKNILIFNLHTFFAKYTVFSSYIIPHTENETTIYAIGDYPI